MLWKKIQTQAVTVTQTLTAYHGADSDEELMNNSEQLIVDIYQLLKVIGEIDDTLLGGRQTIAADQDVDKKRQMTN